MAQRKSKYQPIPKAQQPEPDSPFVAPQPYADEICLWIATGRTLTDYCKQKGKPSFQNVYEWMEKDADFQARFSRAREVGLDILAEETLGLIDEEPARMDGDKLGRYDNAAVQWAKNRAELRLKLLGKWNPKKYGDKIQQEVTGKGGAPLAVEIEFVKAKEGEK